MSSKKLEGPLFYIEQSFIITPQNHNMQEVFTSKLNNMLSDEVSKETEEVPTEPAIASKEIEEETIVPIEVSRELENKPQPVAGPDNVEGPVPIELSYQTEPEQVQWTKAPEQRRSSMNKVKPFKEMSIKERIVYLLDYPKVIPPVQCVFYTNDSKYLGFLVGYEDNQVTIQVPNQTDSIMIPEEDLKNILMIGIRR